MTSLFSPAPVFDFGPGRAGPRGFRDRWRLPLLWPAWEYRVLAPAPRERTLNLFERTTLRLCRAGITSASDIARLLGFDVELAARVLHDLRLKQFIDAYGIPTEDGLNAASDLDTAGPDGFEVGHVFRDAVSGDLFSRIVLPEDRNRALTASEVDDRGVIKIRRGPIGTSTLFRPFAIFPDDHVTPLPLAPDEVLDASERHHRALKSFNKARRRSIDQNVHEEQDAEAERTLSEAERERRRVQVRKVALIDDVPRPAWLYTYAHHAADASPNPDAWTACDPFGLGDSSSLLRLIRKRAEVSPPLQDRIDERTGETERKRQSEAQELDNLRRELASARVIEKLGPAVPSEVLVHLTLMEVALEMGQSGSPYQYRSALSEAQSALEALFGIVLADADARRVRNTLQAFSREGRIEFLNEAAELIGFDTPIPQPIAVQTPGKAASKGRRGSLRAYVAAAICAAHHREDHPLRNAAANVPTLIADLDAVAEIRNEKGGHASSMAPTNQEAASAAQSTYRACEALLPLL